ncbi:ferrous iron transport protein A [Desulfonauticus submarinus]|uniref:Ferrous iron transport protein A n=1 Tax=Desulfonauticus submarinus TaxID=206665 RepID=A0A1H0DZH4_9BACT|nr:FeoA family protein [Desulfonauticus submarinus]SDN75413.1 ferrous iron transport protein A [Desulfonauticus submarinus]
MREVEAIRQSVCLRHMKKRQKGRICFVEARGELGRRIKDMGLIPGTEVEVIGRAPLKDPVALRLRDFVVTLRNNEADYIYVLPEGGTSNE